MLLPEQLFPLRPLLPCPEGVDEIRLFDWLQSVRVDGAPAEIADYCKSDFRRFVYTFGLVQRAKIDRGVGLELGANPYFATILFKQFTDHRWCLANYFGGAHPNGESEQGVEYVAFDDPQSLLAPASERSTVKLNLDYIHFNIEEDTFPYPDASFDIVLLCEIIEHLLMDPARVLREIRRTLKPGGQLILTTPNVSRLENVAKMLSGANIYDPYSGYGPYGRHNREYNKHELWLLLSYLGFEIEEMFTADVHPNMSGQHFDLKQLKKMVGFRQADLGQYIFLRARNSGIDRGRKPSWLYRSYPPEQLE